MKLIPLQKLIYRPTLQSGIKAVTFTFIHGQLLKENNDV